MNKKIIGFSVAFVILALAGSSPEIARADTGVLNVTGGMTSTMNDTTPTFEIQADFCYEDPQTLNYVCNNLASSTLQVLDKGGSSVIVPSAPCMAQDGAYDEYREVLVCTVGQDLSFDTPYVLSVTVQDEFANLYTETSDFTLGANPPFSEIFGGGGQHNMMGGFLGENGKIYGTFQDSASRVFSINADGTDMSVIHSLDSTAQAGLFQIGDKMYGATINGTASGHGAVFSMSLDGTDFALIHEFGFDRELQGEIFSHDGKLYGVLLGLNGSDFSLFSLDADGSNFIEHYVSGSAPYGKFVGPLVPHDGRFYGVSGYNGDPNVAGTVYSVLPDGSDLTILKAFGPGADYGYPYQVWTRLVEHDGTFYGFNLGSADAAVVVYSVKADGSDFTVLDPGFYAPATYYAFGMFFHGNSLYVIGREVYNSNGALVMTQYSESTGHASTIGRFSPMIYPHSENTVGNSSGVFGDKAYMGGYEALSSFALPSLSYSALAHGTISGASSQIPDYDGLGSAVTAVPDLGYQFTSWSDGSTQNPRVDAGVRRALTLAASFASTEPVVETPAPAPEVRRARSGGGSGRRASALPPSVVTSTPAQSFVTGTGAQQGGPVVSDMSVSGAPVGLHASLGASSNMTVGSSGTDVRALQAFLNSRGFRVSDSGAGSPGLETDFFGPRTRDALARFQASVGISPAVGFFGPLTRAAIVGF